MPSNQIIGKRNASALDGYEERIKALYNSLTLDQLKATIDEEAKQKIPKSQYKRKIAQLGLRKYRRTNETNRLAGALAQMPVGSKVFYLGKELSQDEVKRIVSRSRPDIFTQLGSRQMPEGYVIRSPTPEGINNYTADIPFLEFEKTLNGLLEGPRYQHVSRNTGIAPQLLRCRGTPPSGHFEPFVEVRDLGLPSFNSIRLVGNTFFSNNPFALARLGAVMPFSSGNFPSHHDINTANLFLHRQFLFSIANNFAGIDGLTSLQQLDLLQDVSSEMIYQLFRIAKGPTAHSIAQNLFRASIESDSHTLIHSLLSVEGTGLDVNREKIVVGDTTYTPVGRASYLRHRETIRTLIHHDADVNMTYDWRETALAYAVGTTSYTDMHPRHALDIETLKILGNATRAIPLDVISSLIRAKEGDHILYLMQEQSEKFIPEEPDRPHSCYDLGSKNALNILSEENALTVIRALIVFRGKSGLLDDAVYEGYAKLTEKLISKFGVNPDGPTFYLALSGRGGLDFVRRLLSSARSSLHTGTDYPFFTPLSCAIMAGDKKLIDVMRDSGAFEYLHSKPARELAWRATISKGNTEIIDELLQLPHHPPRLYFKYLLVVALRDGNYQSAKESLIRVVKDLFACRWQSGHTNVWSQEPGDSSHDREIYDFCRRLAERASSICAKDGYLEFFKNIRSSDVPEGPKSSKFGGGRVKSPELIELLLDYSINVGSCVADVLRLATPEDGYSLVRRALAESRMPYQDALLIAVKQRNEKLIDIILEEADLKAVLNFTTSPPGSDPMDDGTGLLEIAASMGDDHFIKYLLRKGANPNAPKALLVAFQTDRTVFETILTAYKKKYGFRVKDFGSSVLILAIKSKDTELIRKLLEHNADPHGLDGESRWEKGQDVVTPFGYAIITDNSSGFTLVTQFLNHYCCASHVVSGILFHGTRDSRTTAFLAAITTEKIELLQLLAQGNQSIVHAPARGSIRRTALQRAAEIGSIKMVKYLHNLGADINEPPNPVGGATALQLAAIGGFGQIVCYLIEHGANVNAPAATMDGMTALVGAAGKGRIDIVAILLNKGAGRGEDGDEQFERAIKEAEHYGYYATADYLKERWKAQQQGTPQGRDPIEEFIVDISDDD
ncbi:hypothetical protein O1611_g3357 [Lasiodiplodia mahajangana]|uniref:Uncharacterized protein n=1 Tax=Lasiodiplodia mahajangana TaxID=1108764 RepID=A0ACC2JS11_9PEZI|nr:hypothetical protein O1611_g3357 [Lasiodiplodia mahajangana]